MKLCGNVQPVFTDQSQRVVLEKRCVLAAGHRGPHTDGQASWLNGPDLQRLLSEKANQEPKVIVDMGAKKT